MRSTDDMEMDRRYGRRLDGSDEGLDDVDASDVRDLPTKELLASLFGQGKVLLQEEVRLAKAELRGEVKKVTASAGAVGGGTVLLHTGLLVFSGFLVALLDLWLPLWGAALLVAAVLLGVGAFLALGGIKKLKTANLKPEQTLETLKEDKEWLRRTMHAGTSNKRATA